MSKQENPFEAQSYPDKVKAGYLLASSLIIQDWRYILYRLPLFLVPAFLATLLPQTISSRVVIDLSFRIIALIVIFLIVGRWIARLRVNSQQIGARVFLLLALTGFAYHLLMVGPIVLMTLLPPGLAPLSLVLLVPSLYLALRYYFYFIPVMLGVRGAGSILKRSASLTHQSIWLPLQILLAPFAVALLVSRLILVFSPDESSQSLTMLSEASFGIFYFISTYMALSMALVMMPEKHWSDANLDPYRGSRLNTILLLGSDWLARYLRPGSGALILSVALLVWAGNGVRALTIAPSVSLEVIASNVTEEGIELELYAHDIGSGFRSFYPGLLNLAGKAGTPLSARPQSIQVQGESTAIFRPLSPQLEGPVHLLLVFETDRSSEELRAMEGVFLWYRQYKIQELLLR